MSFLSDLSWAGEYEERLCFVSGWEAKARDGLGLLSFKEWYIKCANAVFGMSVIEALYEVRNNCWWGLSLFQVLGIASFFIYSDYLAAL